jgi:hypothetical protein
MERYLYENVERQQQDDANARAIKLQSEVNKGVMAEQQNKLAIAKATGDSRVEAAKATGESRVQAAETSGRWHAIAAQSVAAQKQETDKARLELDEKAQKWKEMYGAQEASDRMVRDYAEERGRIMGNPNTSDREKRDALDVLNSVFSKHIDASTGKPKQREAAPAAPAAPAGQPAATGPVSWQNKYQPRG